MRHGVLTETHKVKIKICLLAKRSCLPRKVNPLFPFADYRLSYFKERKTERA